MTDLTGKRVLVTGGAGFLGRFVCELIAKRDVAETIIPRRSEYDLTDQETVRRLFREARPDIVLHLAAEVGGIGANRAHPGRHFYANLAMGLHVIEESRRQDVEKFVQIGTVCAYPKHSPTPFLEDDLWNGYPEETNAPYGIAKKSLLVMLEAYREEFDFPGIYLLPVNLYGPGDNFDPETSHVIPALIRKFVQASRQDLPEVTVWGSGTATREFLHVDDAARAIVLATERYEDRSPVNIGCGDEISIRELAKLIADLAGYHGEIRWDVSRGDGQPRRRVDTSRAKERFGFKATVPLREGLERTVAWWEERGEGGRG